MLPCALPLCASRTYQRGHCPPRSAAPSLCVKVVPVWTFPPSPSGSSPAATSATAWSSASTPPVGPRRPKRPARDSGRGARAGLPAPSRLPLGAGGRGEGPRFSAAARRSPSRRPPAPARRRLPAAPARRGGRRRRWRGRCGYGRCTAVAAAVTGCGSSGRNGGDARGTGPLLARRVPYKKRGRDTAVLPKIPHSNCCQRVPNRPLRPRRGRFGTLLQQLKWGIFGRTAVSRVF